jgi:GH15 family glucan-1,4-alpha-glucosidase
VIDSFVQAYGSKTLDASLLLLAIVGFLPPSDPRIVGTVRAIEARLLGSILIKDSVFVWNVIQTP